MPVFCPNRLCLLRQRQRTAVLLLIFGTPAAPTAAAVRPDLRREFLSDARVVELPQWLWQPICRAPCSPCGQKKAPTG